MIYQGYKPIDTMYVGNKLVQQIYKGDKKIYPEYGVIPKAIKDSMVLWYDLGRQGATNDSMKVTPVLRDLSGNEHDATCYNFAWSGMSGVDGYNINFTEWNLIVGSATETIFKIPSGIQSGWLAYSSKELLPFKCKVSGINGCAISYHYNIDDTSCLFVEITKDGIYNLPGSVINENYMGFIMQSGVTSNITIEILPEYPNALVSDGVDDYVLCSTLPTLDDFTIVAKRKIFNTDNIYTFASASDLVATGAFILDSKGDVTNTHEVASFGASTDVDLITDVVYMTPTSYNGTTITKGTNNDGNNLHLFRIRPNDPRMMEGAMYSFILFDRTLTTDEINWVKKNMIEDNEKEVDWYGVEFYTTSTYPDCIRIGNPELHRTLPVQTQMKGVLLSDDGTVNKYLNESDWTSETRDGSQGQVMVEVPEHYVKFETEGTKRRVKMSITPIVGYKKISRYYVSAYEATVQRSTSKLSSVVNTDADYRGGSNNAEWDGTYRSLLGRPVTSISRTGFRTCARNRKKGSTEWNCMTYDIQKDLYWLFVVEYATLNTQKAFNSAKTSEGYAQGGLGDGFTTLDREKWNNFNGNYPVVPCGYTDGLGNGTGQKDYSMPSEYDATIKKLYVSRYRGIENPFGHIQQWTDGINIQIEPERGLSKVFVCDDPSKFNDTNYEGYSHVGNEARASGYVKEIIFGEGGEIMPKAVGGGSRLCFIPNNND